MTETTSIDGLPACRELDRQVALALGYKLCTGDEAIALTNAAFPDRPGWETFYTDDWHILEKPVPDTGLRLLPHYSIDDGEAMDAALETIEAACVWNDLYRRIPNSLCTIQVFNDGFKGRFCVSFYFQRNYFGNTGVSCGDTLALALSRATLKAAIRLRDQPAVDRREPEVT